MTGNINFLKQADIFYQFTATQLELVATLCQEITFHKGEAIFFEGSDSDELYIIVQGEVDIQVTPALVRGSPHEQNQPVTITTLRRGQSFGEIALVDQGLRSATTRAAINETRLLVIRREKLLLLCDTDPQLGYRMMRNLAADLALKLRSTDLLIREELLYDQRRR